MDCNLAIVEKKLRATGSNPWLLDIHAIGWSFTIDSVHNMVACLLRTRKQVKKKGFLILKKNTTWTFPSAFDPMVMFLIVIH